MTVLKNWTKTQVAIGITLLVVLTLCVLAYTFVTDYENAKQNTLAFAQEQIKDVTANQQTEAMNRQTRLDEQLIQANEENALTTDAQFRQDYQALQQHLMTLVTTDEGEGYTKEAKDAVNAVGVAEDVFVSVYVNGTDLSTGTVYYLGQTTQVFHFTYTDGIVTEMTFVETVDTRAVQLVNE